MTTQLVENFLMLLRSAKHHFEIAAASMGSPNARVKDFDSMIFDCARALRIARDAPKELGDGGIDAHKFTSFMEKVGPTRNVIEHWTDVTNPRNPKMHRHISKQGLTIEVDETSLCVLGPTEILKGGLNLYDIYKFISDLLNKKTLN